MRPDESLRGGPGHRNHATCPQFSPIPLAGTRINFQPLSRSPRYEDPPPHHVATGSERVRERIPPSYPSEYPWNASKSFNGKPPFGVVLDAESKGYDTRDGGGYESVDYEGDDEGVGSSKRGKHGRSESKTAAQPSLPTTSKRAKRRKRFHRL